MERKRFRDDYRSSNLLLPDADGNSGEVLLLRLVLKCEKQASGGSIQLRR